MVKLVLLALLETVKRSRVVTISLVDFAVVGELLRAEADDRSSVRRHGRGASRVGGGDEGEMLSDLDFDRVDDEGAGCREDVEATEHETADLRRDYRLALAQARQRTTTAVEHEQPLKLGAPQTRVDEP